MRPFSSLNDRKRFVFFSPCVILASAMNRCERIDANMRKYFSSAGYFRKSLAQIFYYCGMITGTQYSSGSNIARKGSGCAHCEQIHSATFASDIFSDIFMFVTNTAKRWERYFEILYCTRANAKVYHRRVARMQYVVH